jgi:hypothetical protein
LVPLQRRLRKIAKNLELFVMHQEAPEEKKEKRKVGVQSEKQKKSYTQKPKPIEQINSEKLCKRANCSCPYFTNTKVKTREQITNLGIPCYSLNLSLELL